MIDYIKTAELNKTTADEIKARFDRFPNSGKLVVNVCDGCGKVRTSRYCETSDLCKKCTSDKRWRDPEMRAKHAAMLREYWSDPDNIAKASEQRVRYWSDPVKRAEFSATKVLYWSDPEKRRQYAETMRKYYDSAEYKAKQSANKVDYWSDQSNRDTHSDRMSASNAHKAAAIKMEGGNDIVGHHTLYDHSDLSKHVVQMTWSAHMLLHAQLQKLGETIQHINVGVDGDKIRRGGADTDSINPIHRKT